VQYWFPNQTEGGIIAFWAMTYEPSLDSSSDSSAEPLVMVRDLSRDSVVYLFSFTDIESAQAFLRDEVQHGTDLGSMMLYWAVPVRMAADPWGKMILTPAVPPGATQNVELDAPLSDIWTLPPVPLAPEAQPQESADDSRTIFEEAPNAYTGVTDPDSAADDTFQLTAWMERARKKPSADSEAPTPAVARSPRVSAKAPVARAGARLDPPPVDEEILWPSSQTNEAPQATTLAQTVEDAPVTGADSASAFDDATADITEESVVFEAVANHATPLAPAVEEAAQPDEQPEAPEETAIINGKAQIDLSTVRVHVNGNGHLDNPEKHDNGYVTINPAEIVVHENGHSAPKPAEVDFEATPQTTTDAETNAAHDGSSDVDHGVDIRIDIRLESSRAMKVKRWDVKEDPFDGFNSPPGRF
jgi:hypothetical protein